MSSFNSNWRNWQDAYLSPLDLDSIGNPLVSVFNETSGELEYSIPVNKKDFTPKGILFGSA